MPLQVQVIPNSVLYCNNSTSTQHKVSALSNGQFLVDGAPLDATGISSLELHAAINNRPNTRVAFAVEWVNAAHGLFSATIMDTLAMAAGVYEVQAAYIEDGLRKPSTIGTFKLERGV